MLPGEGLSLELQKFTGESLLQHGKLPIAAEMENPLAVDKRILQTCLIFAREVCVKQGLKALAFTELQSYIREMLGFSDQLPPRVIYYRPELMQEMDVLVLNPKIELNYLYNPLLPVQEGCGSIENGRLYYFIREPKFRELSGYFFNGDTVSHRSIFSENPYRDSSLHELRHLDGKTARDRPEFICDIRATKDWSEILKTYSNYSEEELRNILRKHCSMGLLTYDSRQKKLVLVDADGQLIGDYK